MFDRAVHTPLFNIGSVILLVNDGYIPVHDSAILALKNSRITC